jgi:hypothetical protein
VIGRLLLPDLPNSGLVRQLAAPTCGLGKFYPCSPRADFASNGFSDGA